MLKDKLLHEKLGIPQQTLQKWKKSDTYTSLLYKYLVHQEQSNFITDTEKVASFYNYELLTPKEFSRIVEHNWDTFELFRDYNHTKTVDIQKGDDSQIATIAYDANHKIILIIRYIYALSKRKEHFFDEVERTVKMIKSNSDNKFVSRLVYVTTTEKKPKYFDELKHDVSLVSYASLYAGVSDKHLLIV